MADNQDQDSMLPREAYIGPVEIRRVDYGDGRRGMFAKERINAHEIFLKSLAVAVVRKQRGNTSKDASDASSRIGDYDRLVQLVAVKSKRHVAQLNSLASVGKQEMEVPSVEFLNLPCDPTPLSATCMDVDVISVKEIVAMNAFASDQEMECVILPESGHRGLSSGIKKCGDMPATLGLWILPSFINHSCVPNCVQMSVGNIKMISATRDIKAGEELTISYMNSVFAAFGDRARKLPFGCSCKRCILEKQLDAEFAQINARVGALAPVSRKSCATLATRELADLADRVEAMIGAVDMPITFREQGWIRAGFFAAYLAKFQLATVRETDASVRIDTL